MDTTHWGNLNSELDKEPLSRSLSCMCKVVYKYKKSSLVCEPLNYNIKYGQFGMDDVTVSMLG